MSRHVEMEEPFLSPLMRSSSIIAEKRHSGGRGGTLLSKIEDIKTSKQFLEECTYFIGLAGKLLKN